MAQNYSNLFTAKVLKELKSNRADGQTAVWRPIVDKSNQTLDWELSTSVIKPDAVTLKGGTGATGHTGATGSTGPHWVFDNYDYKSGKISGHLRNYDNTFVPSSTMEVGGFPTFELDNSQTKFRIYYGNAQSTERNVKGAKGDKGDQGEQGLQGNPGPEGPQGAAGPEGPKGKDGITYKPHLEGRKLSWVAATDASIAPAFDLNQLKGEAGDPGATGPAGPQGPNGPAGPEGPKGDDGATGPTGNHRKFTGINENGDLVGQRFDYSGHLVGSVGTFPRPQIEISGDKILTKFNGIIQGSVKIQPQLLVESGDLKYRFNTSDVYTTAGKVQGPAGPKGDPGEQGLQGKEGPAGKDGANGKTYTPVIKNNELSWTADAAVAPTFNLNELKGRDGINGETYVPSVIDGQLSWSKTATPPTGSTSIIGPKGDPGPKGDNGEKGKDGLTYHPIITPDKHLKWSIAPVADTVFDLEQLRGPQGLPGQAGANGKIWLPSVSTDGKISWKLTDNTATIAPSEQNITGPKGESGPKGDNGIDGTPGALGPTGYATLPKYSPDDNSLIWGVVDSTKDLISLQGPKGDTGAIGPVGPTGPIKLGSSPFPYLKIHYNSATIWTVLPYDSGLLLSNSEYRDAVCNFLATCANLDQSTPANKNPYTYLNKRLTMCEISSTADTSMTNGGVQIIRIQSFDTSLSSVEYPLIYWTTVRNDNSTILVGVPFRKNGATPFSPISDYNRTFCLDASNDNIQELIWKIQKDLQHYPW